MESIFKDTVVWKIIDWIVEMDDKFENTSENSIKNFKHFSAMILLMVLIIMITFWLLPYYFIMRSLKI